MHEVVTFYTLYFRSPRGVMSSRCATTSPATWRGRRSSSRTCKSGSVSTRARRPHDGRVTLLAVECLCACEHAPMAQVDDRYELDLTPDKLDRILEGLP